MKNFWLLPILLLFVGCQDGSESQIFADTLPTSNGGRLDIIVVAEESIWSEVAGEKFIKYFAPQQDGLPQAEPIFTVRQVPPESFNSLLHRSRNIVVLEEGPETKVTVEKDEFARPQIFIKFTAPNGTELAKLIIQNQEDLTKMLHDSEMEHLQKRVTAKPQPVPKLLKDHHVSMKIPASFIIDQESENTLVLWNKSLKSDQGILVHFDPIMEDDALIGDRIIPLRDSLTSHFIKGDREGSYMVVEDYIPPVFENLKIDGNFAIETRGLWRTKGDFMGGSFINYTVFDETNNQRIMVDAFIYAPEIKKRNLILELEAILRTLEITN
ncbi:DUF4837 family protein [Owenweeksia hongkongensis]|uniref:DUF4837 family protein n=1 Tax=Owenweeksia hongkongensis TaxID=253245 RepID=UPI003A8F6930